MNRGRAHLAFFLVAIAVASGAVAQDFSGDYRVGPRDRLEIRVTEIPELNVERRVSEGGTITLPMIGDFPVSGLTAPEIRARLRRS
jgi:polysaccharide export outer membrane protein